MLTRGLQLVAKDPSLAILCDPTVPKVRRALALAIPPHLLDAPIDSYSVSSLRYTPGKKLLMGLTSSQSMRPIALSVYQRGGLLERLAIARDTHPHHAFAVTDLEALAWVFPGERKLKLGLLADTERLTAVLKQHRRLSLQKVELIDFVPENWYKARISGLRPDGSPVTEHLQVFNDLSGTHIASLIEQLNHQLHDTELGIPDSVSYIANGRILLQSVLPRDLAAQLSDKQAAKAMAHLHRLSAVGLRENDRDYSINLLRTQEAVCAAIPVQASLVKQIVPLIQAVLGDTPTGPRVLLHGDVGHSSLIPLQGGRVGITDFSGMCWGAPEDDLASYYAYKLWLEMRHALSVEHTMSQFPNFIDAYNRHAIHPLDLGRAYAVLAYKLLTERVRQGISTGDIISGKDLIGLLFIIKCCLDEVRQFNSSSDLSQAFTASLIQTKSRTELGLKISSG